MFVTLEDEDAAKRAAETLNGKAFRGRSLGVNLARRGGAPPGGSGGPSAAPRPRPAPRSFGPPSDFPRESLAPSFPDQPPVKDDEAWRAVNRLLREDGSEAPHEREVLVYTPPSYDASPSRRYPLVMILAPFAATNRAIIRR